MRQGLSPEQAVLKALERVVATTQAKLMGSNGRPFVDLQFYALSKDGRFAGGSLYEGPGFAVCDDQGARIVPCVYLYRQSERPRRG
jgi:N4-(beta-N-acetylglucosaminyl)-L-asparaginase